MSGRASEPEMTETEILHSEMKNQLKNIKRYMSPGKQQQTINELR